MSAFQENIKALYGREGVEWLSRLPSQVEEIAAEWGLSTLEAFENLSFNYVVKGKFGTQPIVLKIGFEPNQIERECKALKVFEGYGAPSIICNKPGILLMECAMPGESLITYFPKRENESVDIFCDMMLSLHRSPTPIKGSFESIADWLKILDDAQRMPLFYLEKAREIRDYLLDTSVAPVVLHGDLHHDNIVSHGSNWRAIDPKGVIGEPCAEIPAFVLNPKPQFLRLKNLETFLNKRINLIADRLALDSYRIILWTYVRAVVAWAWSVEDHRGTAYYSKLTKVLYGMIK